MFKMKYKIIVLHLIVISSSLAFECGKQKRMRSSYLISGGTKSFAGQWPWLVTLHKYQDKSKTLGFFCGSSLINENMLITGKLKILKF
jgi:secreted trypsin-like serine protease